MTHEKKVIIRLDGRLGNQLFQLALALNISTRFQVDVLLDDYLTARKKFQSFLFQEYYVFDYFKYCSRFQVLNNRIRHNYFVRKIHRSDSLFIESEHSNLELEYPSFLSKLYESYTGFFQSPRLFPEKSNLIKAFSLKDEFICNTLENLLCLAQKTQNLAISIRRGDFLQSSHLGVCSEQYYIKAIDYIFLNRDIDCIFVFSDDINYCRSLLSFLKGKKIVYVEGFTPAKSLYLMSKCNHFVIANSTFSWWGAWLSEFQDKIVISPSPWNDDQPILSDFIAQNWITLPKHPVINI